jgi:AcrR family transcriptional regulator
MNCTADKEREQGARKMVRTIGSSGERTAEAIRAAGLRLIYAHGFEAMSLRQLAAEVGVQPGSLYNYFANKQALLFEIVRAHMDELLSSLSAALAGIDDPAEKLKTFAAFHLRYHMNRRELVYIATSELRSLEPNNRAKIVALRTDYEAIVIAILAEGAKRGIFRINDAQVVAYAIIAMLTGICEWYRPDGRLSRDELVGIYLQQVMGGVMSGSVG